MRDVRRIQLPSGTVHLRFEDIAATVNPATVHLRSTSQPGRAARPRAELRVRPARSAEAALKYVGREVTLVRTTMEGGSSKTTEVKATLLALNNGPVWRVGNEIVTGMGADHYRFPELPDSLYSRPTLVWALDNQGDASHRDRGRVPCRRHRLERRLRADPRRRRRAPRDLDGWVTMNNHSGTAFTQRAAAAGRRRPAPGAGARSAGELRASGGSVRPWRATRCPSRRSAEYHLYTLGRRTTIANAETKQLALLHGTAVPVARRYVVNGQQWIYRNRQQPGTPITDTVQVSLRLQERRAPRSLGMPMPAGVVRVYQTDGGSACSTSARTASSTRRRTRALSVQIGIGLRRRLRPQADRLPVARRQRLRVRLRGQRA